MNSWIKITAVVSFLIGLIVLIVFVRIEEKSQVLDIPEILIKVEGESAFLTKQELQTRLLRGGLLPKGLTTEKFSPEKVESFIEKMSEVKSVKVYKHGT
jgi:hypothetical protein